MGKILSGSFPCYDQSSKCGSSDAMKRYEDGSTFCFSCSRRFPPGYSDDIDVVELSSYKEKKAHLSNVYSLTEIAEYESRGFSERGITKTVTSFFDVKVSYDENKKIVAHYYPYGVKEVTGYKIRNLPKTFSFAGEMTGLFGQMKFPGGADKRLVITEGELDALTIAQAWHEKYQKIYPVVSISSASGFKELLKHREWIRSFQEVVLWFDNDEPGRKAVEEAAKIIGYDKVKDAIGQFKDASEVYVKNELSLKGSGATSIVSTIYSAKSFSPVGIVNSADTWAAYKKEETIPYVPWAPFMHKLNERNYGRKMGSITMLTSGTGMGKTSWVKEDQYHLHKTRPIDERIGVLSLEESLGEGVKNIMALEANKRIQLPDVAMTDEEERKYWEATMGENRFMFLDHQGSMEDSSIISRMEFMALSGCKYLYLDHITIAVSESAEGSTNTAIDALMSDLLKLAKRYGIWICVISHLRKVQNTQKSFEEGAVPTEDDLKGSGSLKQIPMQIFAISRNKMEKDPIKQNTSYFWVLKDRYTGRTGGRGAYLFEETTGRCVQSNADEELQQLEEELG